MVFVLKWLRIQFNNFISLNNKIFFLNNLNHPSNFYLKKNKLLINSFSSSIKISHNFLKFLKKNFFFLKKDFFFYKDFYNYFNTLTFLLKNNYNFFFFNMTNINININVLNFNYTHLNIFNKNFFFFFFKLNWLKLNKNKIKLINFLKKSNVKLLFFFKPLSYLNTMVIFKNLNFLCSGIPNLNKKNNYFDYPIYLDNNNIFHIYFTYQFFVNLIINKNILNNQIFFKTNFFFFNFFMCF